MEDMKRTIRYMSNAELVALVEMVGKEREHRRQAQLGAYRAEIEQMYTALVHRVKELDALDIDISMEIEDDEGSRYFSLTDKIKEEGFMVRFSACALYKSKS